MFCHKSTNRFGISLSKVKRSSISFRYRPLKKTLAKKSQTPLPKHQLQVSFVSSLSPAKSQKYPGINISLFCYPDRKDTTPHYPIGADPECDGVCSELLPVREVCMMLVMDSLTDKVDWHKKIFDLEIVGKWRKEALEQPEDGLYFQAIDRQDGEDEGRNWAPVRQRIITEATFDFCIEELRNKAAYFNKTGLIPTLDSAGNTVVKSDSLITPGLQKELQTAFTQLCADQASDVDWHPRSDDMVRNLVHPSMYPFIYGKSNFLQEEVVGVSDAVSWACMGETAPEPYQEAPQKLSYRRKIPHHYWSTNYQWLPANLAFQEDGTIKFTSYINNLHPNKYPQIYRTVEKLIDKAIPAWDQCLSEYTSISTTSAGRHNSRFSQPETADDEDDALWEPFNAEVLAESDVGLGDWGEYNCASELERNGGAGDEAIQRAKWSRISEAIIPEPDSTENVSYAPKESLHEKFKSSGLQVIVKMATIELTPEKPEFSSGSWHIEGQMNERICATALYYLDSENVTPSHLSFRMQTSSHQDELQYLVGQDAYSWLEHLYGTSFSSTGGECIQHYGSVETKEGRLLAFPNVFQHRVSSFKLEDPTKQGHRRFIALWLVDPHQRIVSTANVPPQRLDWCVEAAFRSEGGLSTHGNMSPELSQMLLENGRENYYTKTLKLKDSCQEGRKLPEELMEMVPEKGLPLQGLLTKEEANAHRLALMDERTQQQLHHQRFESGYSFCEH